MFLYLIYKLSIKTKMTTINWIKSNQYEVMISLRRQQFKFNVFFEGTLYDKDFNIQIAIEKQNIINDLNKLNINYFELFNNNNVYISNKKIEIIHRSENKWYSLEFYKTIHY